MKNSVCFMHTEYGADGIRTRMNNKFTEFLAQRVYHSTTAEIFYHVIHSYASIVVN